VKIRDYRVWTKTAKNEKIIYIKKISKWNEWPVLVVYFSLLFLFSFNLYVTVPFLSCLFETILLNYSHFFIVWRVKIFVINYLLSSAT
jgi:hypothetical protein